MLIKYTDFLQKVDQLSKPYKGTVVDNADPRKLGRVKVKVQGMLEGTADELPWVFPRTQSLLGGRGDVGTFGVPRIGSELVIEFPYKDVYSGFYVGYWQSETTHQGTFNLDYPNSYGFRDEQGTEFLVSLARKIAEFNHTSHSGVGFSADGTVEIRSPKVIRLTSADRKTVLEFNMETGAVTFTPKEGTNLGGQSTTVVSDTFTNNAAEVRENIEGSKEVRVGGGSTETIAGSASKSVLYNYQSAIGGNFTELITQLVDRTVGLGVKETIAAGGINSLVVLGNVIQTLSAGLYSLTASLGISMTTPLNITLTAAQIDEIVSILNQTVATAFTLVAGTNISMTAGAAMNLMATGNATLAGANTMLGSAPTGPVLTQTLNPFIDLITGSPSVGCATVLAGP